MFLRLLQHLVGVESLGAGKHNLGDALHKAEEMLFRGTARSFQLTSRLPL